MNEQTQAPTSQPCPECGGQRIFTQCDPRMALRVSVFSFTPLIALACTRCGYTRFYVKEPEKLHKLLEN